MKNDNDMIIGIASAISGIAACMYKVKEGILTVSWDKINNEFSNKTGDNFADLKDVNKTPNQALNVLNPVARIIMKIKNWFYLRKLKNGQ